MPIPWLSAFNTGNTHIDEDHRRLVAMVNKLEIELQAGNFETANRHCHVLRDLVQQHFDHEEKLLREMSFPRLDQHCAGHGHALGEVAAIVAQCRENCQVGMQIGCPARWSTAVVDHVLMADLDFKSYIQSRKGT